MQPTLYYDLGSPYAYLAAERAAGVLGVEPHFEPVLVGGIFAQRGHGSWAHTEEREARIAEIETRARSYGLPPLRWPPGWPNNTLQAMRAAVWAGRLGQGGSFALAGFRRAFGGAFGEGTDLSRLEELLAVAESVGLPAAELPQAIAQQEIKDALRAATERAWERGAIGVPCIEVGDAVFFGDDRLEDAAHLLARQSPS